METYRTARSLASEIKEKRNILRERYGGMINLNDLMEEFGCKSKTTARATVIELGIPATKVGRSKKYDTDIVARRLVELRGMC